LGTQEGKVGMGAGSKKHAEEVSEGTGILVKSGPSRTKGDCTVPRGRKKRQDLQAQGPCELFQFLVLANTKRRRQGSWKRGESRSG